MDSTTTKPALNPNSGDTFVPMSESQMASTKGGDDCWQSEEFQEMILDWIEEQTQDPDSIVTQILSTFLDMPSIDQGIWDEIADDMESEGLTWPSAESLNDSLFMGGDGV